MIKYQIIRDSDGNRFMDNINKFATNHRIIHVQYNTEFVANEYNSKGVPISGSFYDSAFISYEDSEGEK